MTHDEGEREIVDPSDVIPVCDPALVDQLPPDVGVSMEIFTQVFNRRDARDLDVEEKEVYVRAMKRIGRFVDG
jgi:hypothetical protein